MELQVRRQKRLSVQHQQINKDNELWELNCMLTSGVVSSLDHDDDPDVEGETSSLAASKITDSKERFGTSHSIP